MPHPDHIAVRAKSVIPLAGEGPARGTAALSRPLERLDDAVIAAQGGTIVTVEPYRDYRRRPGSLPPGAIRDLGAVTLAPGLVNSHTHLEISHMAGKTRMGTGFCDWLSSLIALDRNTPDSAEADLRAAVRSLSLAGTACVGDISSRISETVLAALRAGGITPRIFCEIIGHRRESAHAAVEAAAQDDAFSLAGHALYTTSGELIQQAKAWCVAHGRPFSLHLAEHADERECVRDGTGKLHDMLRQSIVPASWRAPGFSPVQYAASLGVLSPGTLAVHCVHCDKADIRILAASCAAVCMCPRSNRGIGVGEAPAKAFADKGILLALGTDSLASNTDLDVWHEAEFFLKKNVFPANALLRMATVNGAAVLGVSSAVGRLEKGMRFCYRVFPSEVNTLFH